MTDMQQPAPAVPKDFRILWLNPDEEAGEFERVTGSDLTDNRLVIITESGKEAIINFDHVLLFEVTDSE